MAQRIRPIWQIMATVSEPGQAIALTCDECFAILDHLAGMAMSGAQDKDLKIAVHAYLAHCPDCVDYYEQRIEELQSWLDRHRKERQA